MKLTHFAIGGLFLLLAAAIYLTMQTDMDGRMEKMKADYDRKLELMENARQNQQPSPAVASNPADAATRKIGRDAGALKSEVSRVPARVKEEAGYPPVSEALKNVKANLKDRVNDPAREVNANVTSNPAEPNEPVEALPPELLEKERDILNSSGVGAERIALDTAVVTGAVAQGDKLTNVQSLVVAQPRIARVKNSEEAERTGFVVLDKGLNANLAKGDSFAVRRGTAIIGRVTIGDTIHETECVADVVMDKLVTGMALKPGDEIIKFDR